MPNTLRKTSLPNVLRLPIAWGGTEDGITAIALGKDGQEWLMGTIYPHFDPAWRIGLPVEWTAKRTGDKITVHALRVFGKDVDEQVLRVPLAIVWNKDTLTVIANTYSRHGPTG